VHIPSIGMDVNHDHLPCGWRLAIAPRETLFAEALRASGAEVTKVETVCRYKGNHDAASRAAKYKSTEKNFWDEVRESSVRWLEIRVELGAPQYRT